MVSCVKRAATASNQGATSKGRGGVGGAEGESGAEGEGQGEGGANWVRVLEKGQEEGRLYETKKAFGNVTLWTRTLRREDDMGAKC